MLRAADGQETFAGWRDTQLNLNCYFWPASDGERRCVPNEVTYAVEGYFADAQCTQPVYRGPSCNVPAMLYRYDQSVCPTRWSFFEVGPALSQRQMYLRSGTSCLALTLDASEQLWRVGASIAPGRFVRGAVTEPVGNVGVGQRFVAAEDGARGPFGLRDLAAQAECSEAELDDGAVHCVPADRSYDDARFRADSSCASPAMVVGAGACPPHVWSSRFVNACRTRTSMARRGQELSRYYFADGATCSAQALSSQARAFAIVPEPASSFPAATVTRRGSARLQREVRGWPGGLEVESGFFDTQLSSACNPWYVSADGARRCLPPFSNTWDDFADAACTQRVVEGDANCPPRFAARWETVCSSQRVRLFSVGARHQGAVYSTRGGGNCAQLTTTSSWFLVGAEVPSSTFVEFTDATLP